MDGASFDFDDFIFRTGNVVAVQFGAGISATTRATKAARTSGRGFWFLEQFSSTSTSFGRFDSFHL